MNYYILSASMLNCNSKEENIKVDGTAVDKDWFITFQSRSCPINDKVRMRLVNYYMSLMLIGFIH